MFSKKEKILYAAKKYHVALDDIYYIGDTTGDIKEGKQAGVKLSVLPGAGTAKKKWPRPNRITFLIIPGATYIKLGCSFKAKNLDKKFIKVMAKARKKEAKSK